MPWKNLCKRCFAISMDEKINTAQNPFPKTEHPKYETEDECPIEGEVAEMLKIAKQLKFDLGKEVLDVEEKKWVTSIYIQRKKMQS